MPKNFTSSILTFVFHYIKSRKYRYLPSFNFFLCIFVLTISVSSLILVKSVMNGFRNDLIESIISINAHVNLYSKNGNNIKDFKEDTEKLKNISNKIKLISPSLTSTAMISKGKYSNGVILKSFDDNNLEKRGSKFQIIENKNQKFQNNKGILIGFELANRMGIKIDSDVTITIPKIINTMIGSFPISKDFKVVGFVRTGSMDYDSSVVILNILEYRNMFQIEKEEVSEIGLYLDNYKDSEEVRRKIRNTKDFWYKYRITDWQMENYGLINALKTESVVMSIILSLFVIIAMIGVYVTINNTVKEKQREIGVMYSMGMFNYEVLIIFFLISFIITLIGLIFGLLLGIVLALKLDNIRIFIENAFNVQLFDNSVYLLAKLPSRIDFFDVIWTVCLVLTLSLIFGIIPAWRASRKNPVEILREFSF